MSSCLELLVQDGVLHNLCGKLSIPHPFTTAHATAATNLCLTHRLPNVRTVLTPTGARRVLSQSLPPSPTGRDASRSAAGGTSPLRAFQPHSRIPAGMGQGLGHHRGRASPPQTHVMPIGYGISRIGSPPGSAGSPALVGPSPSRAAPSPRVSPSPRVVREQWGGAMAEQGASPRLIGGNSRAGRAGRMSCFVSQSLDGSLLQAGAAREQQAQLAALQQVGRGVGGCKMQFLSSQAHPKATSVAQP